MRRRLSLERARDNRHIPALIAQERAIPLEDTIAASLSIITLARLDLILFNQDLGESLDLTLDEAAARERLDVALLCMAHRESSKLIDFINSRDRQNLALPKGSRSEKFPRLEKNFRERKSYERLLKFSTLETELLQACLRSSLRLGSFYGSLTLLKKNLGQKNVESD